MAWKIVEEVYIPSLKMDKVKIVMDSTEDAKNLPKCCPDSTAYVADKDLTCFVVNASGEWKKI